jgi:uncharacterized protein with FMN-binding domain
MTPTPSRWLAAGLATAATAGVLAGCGSGDETTTAAAADQATTPVADDTATAAETTTAAEAAASSGYADGTYDAEGEYQSPGGKEHLGVSLTLKDGTVTAVTVTPKATNPNSKKFQGEFEGGIADVVVGKPIDGLEVSKVAGSSLSSGGFNAAVETIKADAKS